MTITTVTDFEFPTIHNVSQPANIASVTNILVDASGEKAAFIFRVSETGSITDVTIRSGGTVSSAGDADVRLETVGSDGFPSGTLVNSGANGTVTISTIATFYTATFTTPASVTAGQLVALVIAWTSGAWQIACWSDMRNAYPYVAQFTSSWAKITGAPIAALSYGGTYYPLWGVAVSPTASQTLNTGTTPDEAGNLFTLPFTARLKGFLGVIDVDGLADVVLYDGSNNVIASVSLDNDQRIGTLYGSHRMLLASKPTLTANTSYRLVLKPTTTTTIGLGYWNLPSAAARAQAPGGTGWTYTARTDAGSWAETTTRQAFLYLLLDGIDLGGGGIGQLVGEGLVS